MVRAKAAETAEKKAPVRKAAAAAAKTATPEKKEAAAPAKEETPVEQVAEEVPAEDVEATGGDETVEGVENAEGGEGGEEGGEQAEGDEQAGKKPRFERTPPTEEDLAYIKELLETKVKLTDESEVQLFSYGPPKVGAESFVRNVVCHLCRVAHLQKMAGIKSHLEGKRHLENLKRKSLNNGEHFKQPYLLFYSREGNQVKQFKIFPGENIEAVTPEYEDRIVDRAEWEMKKIEDEKLLKVLSDDRIYEYNKIRPVIGLDYLVKMKHKGKIRKYCVMCEEFLVTDTYQHVVDIKHQATYIIKHFPTLYEKVSEGLTIKHEGAKENCVRNIFRKLYRKIEIKHGFKKMIPVDSGDFLTLRSRYINKIRKMPHYGEESIQFTDAEVDVLIKKCNNNVSFNEPDPPTQPMPDEIVGSRKRRGDVSQTDPMAKNRRLAPGGGPNAPVHDIQRSWGVYRTVKNKRMERLKNQYKRYEKDAKLHPGYKEEWSKFWNRRCEELKKENVNTETYNFNKEWLPIWERTLRKLYHKDVTDRKTALRQKFNLPLRGRTPEPTGLPNNAVNMRQLNEMVNMISNQSMMGPGPMMGNSGNFGPPVPNMMNMNMNTFVPPQFGNQPNPNNYGRGGNMGGGFGGGPNQGGPRGGGGRQRNMQQQPLQQQNQRPQQQQNQRMPQQVQQQQQQQPSRKRPAPRTREPVSVITALRLLTALEDQLGSLGPKSVQLLGKAVLFEKNKQNLNDLLADNEYYMFFATAKEKLKGQIMANVIDPSKISPVNSTIEDLTQLLKLMDKESNNRGVGGGGRNQNANSGGGRNQNANTGGGRNQNANNDGVGRNQNANTGGGRNQNANSGGGRNQKANNSGGRGGGRNQNANNGGGDNFGRNMGNNGNDQFANNNNGNYGNDGNFGGNVDNFRSNNDGGNYRGGFNNDNANNRMSSNFDSGNYRDSNDGGNYRNDSGNFSNNNLGGSGGGNNYRSNDDNFRGGNSNFNDGGNYRSNSGGGGNYGGGNTNSGNSLSSYRGNDLGNFGSGTGSFGGTGGGNLGGNLGQSSSNFSSSTNQYRSGGNFGNNDNFNSKQPSNFGGSGGGNWMGGSGSVYSSNNSKLSSLNTPAFSSGLGGGSNALSSFGNNRNTSNFGSGGGGNNGGNFRRYN